MNFKKGDKVVVIAGKSKGKEGSIISVLRNENKVVVEGANMVKKTFKTTRRRYWFYRRNRSTYPCI